MNVALSRKFDLAISSERMIPNAQPVKPDISFSAVDGSRPWSPAWQSPGLKNNSKQPNEPKKRLPTAYIEKYFE